MLTFVFRTSDKKTSATGCKTSGTCFFICKAESERYKSFVKLIFIHIVRTNDIILG